MKRVLAIAVIGLILLAASYYVGYRGEHQRFSDCQKQHNSVSQQLADAQGQLRIWNLEGRLRRLIESVQAKNFGQAHDASTTFFNEVRSEAARTERGDFRSTLNSVLQSRDAVVTGLTRGDPAVLDTLRQSSNQIRGLVESR
jgi:hypothetical protein